MKKLFYLEEYQMITKNVFTIFVLVLFISSLSTCYANEDSDDDLVKKGFDFFNKKEYSEAVKYYKLAADQGDLESQKKLEKIKNYQNKY